MEWAVNPIRCYWLVPNVVPLLHQHMGTQAACLSTTMGYVAYRYISFIIIVVVIIIHMQAYVSQNHSKNNLTPILMDLLIERTTIWTSHSETCSSVLVFVRSLFTTLTNVLAALNSRQHVSLSS